MKTQQTEIYVSALRLAVMVAQRAANYDHRFKYIIGARSIKLCECALRTIAQGYERRKGKAESYSQALDAIAGLKAELVLANELNILSVENKAKIDLMVEDVERQLKAVICSLWKISGSECRHDVATEHSNEKDFALSLIAGGE